MAFWRGFLFTVGLTLRWEPAPKATNFLDFGLMLLMALVAVAGLGLVYKCFRMYRRFPGPVPREPVEGPLLEGEVPEVPGRAFEEDEEVPRLEAAPARGGEARVRGGEGEEEEEEEEEDVVEEDGLVGTAGATPLLGECSPIE